MSRRISNDSWQQFRKLNQLLTSWLLILEPFDVLSINPTHLASVQKPTPAASAGPQRLAVAPIQHYENFPVASFLCPARLRPAVAAIYHFARTADDLADEGDASAAQRLVDLQTYRDELLAPRTNPSRSRAAGQRSLHLWRW
jgi:hypothetical protein